MRVIGTAGHVDHGKSSLVRALSGIDPDRLKEEKARGMTIDLGFAWITLPPADARPDGAEPAGEAVGIVDVPGHIDFIKNMLAGVGGIDLALLVVAADEGIMPQTREHLAILDLLAIPTCVVALTKVDLVDDPDWLELVELDIHALLELTHLRNAPVVPVSASTGQGLDEMRRALAGRLAGLPPRRNRARPRLPVDRVFTLSGFGTIVTGTLLDGPLAAGDAVELLPSGRAARIRGLQTHKQSVSEGQPGSRVAVNLGGVDASQVHRGDVVARPGTLMPTVLADARVRLLSDASSPLAHNARVDLFVGAAEIPAHVRVLGADRIESGQEAWVQLRLERPAVLAAGDRFILRAPSPSVTLGGGVVLAPHPRRRWKRFEPAVIARLETLASGAPDELLLEAIARAPFVAQKQLLAQVELDPDTASAALAELVTSGALLAFASGAETNLLVLDAWNRIAQNLRAALASFHQDFPLRTGMARSELRSRLQLVPGGAPSSLKLFNTLVDYAQSQGILDANDAFVWLPGFRPTLSIAEQSLVDRALAAFASNPRTPPNASETLALLENRADLLEMLVDQGALLRVGGDVLFVPAEFDAMVARVEEHLRERRTITMAEARDLLNTSRKYVQALLEEMDARRITRRDGDLRVLR